MLARALKSTPEGGPMYVLGVYILGPFPFSAGEGGCDFGSSVGPLADSESDSVWWEICPAFWAILCVWVTDQPRFLPGRMPLSLLSRSPAGNLVGLLRGGRGMLGCTAQMPGHD